MSSQQNASDVPGSGWLMDLNARITITETYLTPETGGLYSVGTGTEEVLVVILGARLSAEGSFP